MAARKLQTEIDRTLKKVAEGVELFESIYDKMHASTNQTQKEKLETDLKTQIKKLQRLRDQIKSWVASSDVKDKSLLLDNRKLIETQMEKFKACEKEMKTKAFSKEGLTAAHRLDPKAQEKSDTIAWIQTMVDELSMQVETAEAEVETLQGGTKKKGKGGGASERLEELEHLNERRKWHVGRLEIILRLLENGSMATEKIVSLKEDVKYFVESNTEEDFEEDEGIYDELNLEEEEGRFGLALDEAASDDDSLDTSDDLPPRTPMKENVRKVPAHDDDIHHRKDDTSSPILKKGIAARKHSTTESRPSITANFSQQPMASVVKATLPPPRAPAQPPLMRYSAAAAAGTPAPNNGPSVTPPGQSTPAGNGSIVTSTSVSHTINGSAGSITQEAPPLVPPSPSLTHPSLSAASPILSSNSTSGQPAPSQASRATPPPESVSFDSHISSPVLSEAAPAATSSPHRTPAYNALLETSRLSPPPGIPGDLASYQGQSSQPAQRQPLQPSPTSHPAVVPSLAEQTSSARAPLEESHSPHPATPPGVNIPRIPEFPAAPEQAPLPQARDISLRSQSRASIPQVQDLSSRAEAPQHALPSSLSDLLVSFDGAKQKAATRMSDLNHVHKILEAGYPNMPQPRDTSKPKYYVPRHPYQTPAYYPQAPHPVLSTPSVFSQIDVETLFYVFYYLPGSYQQYLAAKELKKQSWRFHVKYLTWFQRHSEPQAITEEYEQGVYVYFDWEGSWCQRKKSDFRFEYRYLSED